MNSELEQLYHRQIRMLARAAYGAGRLAGADGSAMLANPLCGDQVTVDIVLRGGLIAAIGHEVKGCLLCQASASAIGREGAGWSAAEVEYFGRSLKAMLNEGAPAPEGWPALSAFSPVNGHRSRHGCVLLPFEALAAALRAAADRRDHRSGRPAAPRV
ncbi:MAG: iron-sulfur cluster assembly scaffold protein [Betaproteobacteria bacterium]|nr:iron-sulfur cluster assembly scaffold protein [Betaproteobacteria bacterium]